LRVRANVERVQDVCESVYCEVERFSSADPVRRVGVGSVVVVVHPNTGIDSAVVECGVKSEVFGCVVCGDCG